MLANVLKYNFFNCIPGLYSISRRIAGQECYINRREKMIYYDAERSNRRDGFISYDNLGERLVNSGKLPVYVGLDFPNDPKRVRDFLRLILRTKVSFFQAAELNGIKVRNLSRCYVDF